MSLLRRFRDAAICILLLAVPFFFLNANLKDPSRTNVLDRFVLKASAPIQYVAREVAGGLSGVLEEYVLLIDVRGDNDRLQREAARLRAENRDLRKQAHENQRLRDLLDLRSQLQAETLSAQVIGKEVSPLFRVIRIRLDRGENDLIRPGMPVISSEGLVGQVRRSAGRYSDVLLTVDQSSAIDVVVQRSGATGLLRGRLRGTGGGEYLCRIQYLRRDEDVAVGDELHTSGLGQKFPAGILVGRVSNIVRREFGLYQEVEVTPAVNFSSLEEVLVLTEGSRERGLVGDGEESGDQERGGRSEQNP